MLGALFSGKAQTLEFAPERRWFGFQSLRADGRSIDRRDLESASSIFVTHPGDPLSQCNDFAGGL